MRFFRMSLYFLERLKFYGSTITNFTGIGLAMDTSAVSIAKGMSLPNEKNKNYALN